MGRLPLRPICEVKVQHVARPPAPWGWVIHVEGQSTHVYTSNGRYRSAQEAWEAGQKALAILQQDRRPALPCLSANMRFNIGYLAVWLTFMAPSSTEAFQQGLEMKAAAR